MKSNKKLLQTNALGKTIKATLPFLVAMGGGAFATTRSSNSVSRRRFVPSAVFVASSRVAGKTDNHSSHQQHLKNNKPAFSAFSQNKTKHNLAEKKLINHKALDFLKTNNLLNAGQTVKAELSGNILGRKVFAHANLIPNSFYSFQACEAPTWKSFQYLPLSFNFSLSTSCNLLPALTSVSPAFAKNLAGCEVLHDACHAAAPANTPPTSPNLSQPVNFTEDMTAAIADMLITDPDADTFTATVAMAQGNDSLGALSATSGNGETFNPATGVWTITSVNLTAINNALAALSFIPKADIFTNTTASTSISDGANPAIAGTITFSGTAVADTPSVTNASTFENQQTSSGLVISRNIVDGAEVTHFQITGITNGTLFQADGTTAIANNDFITAAQANAGLKFTPALNSTSTGSFNVQAATSAAGAGLSVGTATATITVNAIVIAPTPTPIPTLTHFGIGLLISLIGLLGAFKSKQVEFGDKKK